MRLLVFLRVCRSDTSPPSVLTTRVAADPEWRGSVQPFFPVSLSASASVKSALTVLDTSTNTLITKLAGNTMEPAALVHGFDSLALLVRLRTLQACASARDPDDFELELFQAWLKEKDGRTVERLLVASLLSNEVGHRKSDAIKVRTSAHTVGCCDRH